MAEWKDFERTWRAWLDRPPRRSAAEAARRVVDGIGPRRARWGPWRPALAAAAAVLVGAALLVLSLRSRPAPSPAPVRPGGEVAVMMLDASTPLYMNLKPLELGQGGGS